MARCHSRTVLLLSALLLGLIADAAAQTAVAPIRVGGTLALTGPLAAAGNIQKLVGEIYVERLNRKGGLLGRPVEFVVRDDQSRPDLTRTLYEQLVTVERVDLLMGPYGTGAILSAMGVAQRYNKMLIHNSFGVPSLARYENQFPAGGTPANPENAWPHLVFTALAASSRPPQTVAIVTSKFPSVHFVSLGAREIAKKRDLKEVAFLEWEFGNRDFGPIASRIKDAKPDFVWIGAIGLDGVLLLEALKKIDFVPQAHFHMFPAPGPTAKSRDAANALALTVFEEHPPFTSNPVAAEFVKSFNERAAKAGLSDTSVELLSAIAFAGWQALEAAVPTTRSLDDKVLAAWMKKNRVKTIIGELHWDGPYNHPIGVDIYKLKQVQNGKWVVVWPREFSPPGVKLVTN